MKLNSLITSSTCFIRGSIGLPCPLCGMTRALKLFFNGDIQGAFNMHPLFVVPIILLILVIIRGVKILNKYKYVILVLFMSVYIYRMISMFPHISPLTFNNKAIFARVINLIFSIF